MNGTLALARLEMLRVLRNKRYLIFTIGLPVVLYLAIGKQTTETVYGGVAFKAFYMIAMASIGAFSGALTGNAQRIAQERKDGWIRQLRITSLPAGGYVIAKIIASLVTSVPSIVIVLALGHFYGGVDLAAWKWITIGVAIWLGSMTFAALAVAIGYRFLPDTVQPMSMLVYLFMSVLGGLWFAVGGTMQKIAQVLPTYQITRIGTGVILNGTVSMTAVAVILAWLAGFVILAGLSVRSTAEKI
jgi:ABC-2 type transport system permease protein